MDPLSLGRRHKMASNNEHKVLTLAQKQQLQTVKRTLPNSVQSPVHHFEKLLLMFPQRPGPLGKLSHGQRPRWRPPEVLVLPTPGVGAIGGRAAWVCAPSPRVSTPGREVGAPAETLGAPLRCQTRPTPAAGPERTPVTSTERWTEASKGSGCPHSGFSISRAHVSQGHIEGVGLRAGAGLGRDPAASRDRGEQARLQTGPGVRSERANPSAFHFPSLSKPAKTSRTD